MSLWDSPTLTVCKIRDFFLHTATSLSSFHSWLESDTRGEIQRNTLYTSTYFYIFLLFSFQRGMVYTRIPCCSSPLNEWLTDSVFLWLSPGLIILISKPPGTGKPPASLTSTEFRIDYETMGGSQRNTLYTATKFYIFLLFSFPAGFVSYTMGTWVTDWQCARCSTVCISGFTQSHYPEILSWKPHFYRVQDRA